MNQFRKILIPAICVTTLIISVFFVLRPKASIRANSVSVKATVTKVSEGGLKDIVISLQGIRGMHYISKGHTHGLTIPLLSKKLLNKEVTILYVKPSGLSKLSPMIDTRNIKEIKLGKEIVYSDFK